MLVIDATAGKSLELYHEDDPSAVWFSPDDRRLLVGTRGRATNVYDLAEAAAKTGDLHPVRRYVGHTAAVTAFGYSPDGKRLATGAADGTIKVWDSESELEAVGLAVGRTNREPVLSLWFTADGQRLVALPEDAPPVAFDGAPREAAFHPVRYAKPTGR